MFGSILTVFIAGTFKFMFAPIIAAGLGFNFFESWVISASGASFASSFFYWLSDYFMRRNHKKKVAAYREAIKNGEKPVLKKNFTKVNKAVVRVKKSIGWFGISMFAPLFLSIPIGSIVVAKFYGKRMFTFPLILIGISFNSFIITVLAHFIF